MKHFATIFASALLAFGLAGCKTIDESDFVKVDPPPEYQSASFSYQPSKSQEATGVSLGVARMIYSSNIELGESLRKKADTLSKGLEKSVSSGLQRILTSNGFSAAGTFKSRDQMTFPEKEETTMVLVPKIDLRVSSTSGKAKEVYWRSEGGGGKPKKMPLEIYHGEVALGGNKYKKEGQVKIESDVNITLVEPLTGEELLSKSLNIAGSSKEWVWYYWRKSVVNEEGDMDEGKRRSIKRYDNRASALESAFEETYTEIMKKVEESVSNKKITRLKKDATKLKERWRSSNE